MVHAGFLLTASALLLTLFVAAPAQPRSRQDVKTLIAELRTHPWGGPHAVASPLAWDFGFTPPMLKILEVGPPAQRALIEALKDPVIKHQAIILLGGLGDERAVGPIIAVMADEQTHRREPAAARTNLAANIALTNITVADVIWHHGGGIVRTDPPPDSKRRWAAWWEKNRARFTVRGITRSRRYSNYPNYGIYRQP